MLCNTISWLSRFASVSTLFLTSAYSLTPYYSLDVAQGNFTGPLDQSSLNRGLTMADRITVQKGHFFTVGKDGQAGTNDDRRIRLYGVNLSHSANFPDAGRARQIAHQLRSLGVNVVRLHQLDNYPDGNAETTNSVLRQGAFPTFNRKAIERLKVFLSALKEQGIYVDLNLYVGYRFRPEVDNIPPVVAGVSPLPSGAPVHIFYPRLVDLQVAYAKELIGLLGLGNDPMLAMIEIRNESSLAAAWQSWGTDWPDTIRGAYAEELTRQWNTWLIKNYGSVAKACERWAGCPTFGQQPLVSPAEADELRTSQRSGFIGKIADRLPTWSGLSAAPDTASGKGQRLTDFVRFIVDTDKHYFETIKGAVREAAHPLVPVMGTQMRYGGPLNYLSHGAMDYLDYHFYIDHFDFPGREWDHNDWRIRDNAIETAELRALVEIAAQRDIKRPFVISEYNQMYPNRQGAEMTPLIALLGALQDWDALFHFDYIDGSSWGVTPSGFNLMGDWPKLTLTGQSARIFRGALVPPLSAQLSLALDSKSILRIGALRQRENRGLAPNPWPVAKIFQARLGTVLEGQPAPQGPVLQPVSASVTYKEEHRRVVFEAPQLAGFLGKFAPGERIGVGDWVFEPIDQTRGFATIVITSLDEQPIAKSGHILLSVPGHVMETQPGTARPKKMIPYKNSGDWWTLEPDPISTGKPLRPSDSSPGPVWMERIPLNVTFRTQASAVKVFPLKLTGERLEQLSAASVQKLGNGYEFKLQMEAAPQSPWYEIVVTHATTQR